MTRTSRFVVLAVAAALSSALAAAGGPAGYLDAGSFDIMQVLPPAPVRGDGRYQSDRQIFRATRKFVGTPRWDMATRDVSQKSADMLHDFSCAVGVALDPSNAPRTAALVERAAIDTAAQKNRAKDFYKRSRPYKIDPGPVCQPRAELDGSYDYPSGHTTSGWTWALILAELAPDRATPILARGRAYGQSRMVCGAHNESAVEAGWLTADATMAVVRTRPAYLAEAAAARAELDRLRHDPAAARPEACEAEAALVREPVL